MKVNYVPRPAEPYTVTEAQKEAAASRRGYKKANGKTRKQQAKQTKGK